MINYFSQVIRSQRVKKSLTLINITGLSVCIATALLIILYVWSELSYDSFHNTERVYRVESRLYEGKTLTDNWATTAYGHAPAMAREIAGIENALSAFQVCSDCRILRLSFLILRNFSCSIYYCMLPLFSEPVPGYPKV